MSVYMPKINYILLIYRNLFITLFHTSRLLLLNGLMELLGTNTDIHFKYLCMVHLGYVFDLYDHGMLCGGVS